MGWFYFRLVFGIIGTIGGISLGLTLLSSLDLVWYLYISAGAFFGMIVANAFTYYVRGAMFK